MFFSQKNLFYQVKLSIYVIIFKIISMILFKIFNFPYILLNLFFIFVFFKVLYTIYQTLLPFHFLNMVLLTILFNVFILINPKFLKILKLSIFKKLITLLCLKTFFQIFLLIFVYNSQLANPIKLKSFLLNKLDQDPRIQFLI